MRYAGELASLATAFCWTAGSLSFSAAGRRVGSLPVNIIRMVLAILLVSAITAVTHHSPLPIGVAGRAWLWLCISGFVGFFIGDLCLFRALVLIGPRLSMLIMALWPAFAAVLTWLTQGETLTPMKLAGMAVTLAGIAWVTAERSDNDDAVESDAAGPTVDERLRMASSALTGRHRLNARSRGMILAVLGALGQAGGYVLAKPVMAGLDPFTATQIRSLAGLAGFVAMVTFLGAWPRVWQASRHPPAMALTVNGAFWGPCLGVSLSLLALRFVPVGVAATLASTSPVLMIPCVVVLHREKVSLRAVLGACVAVAGVAMLFLNPTHGWWK